MIDYNLLKNVLQEEKVFNFAFSDELPSSGNRSSSTKNFLRFFLCCTLVSRQDIFSIQERIITTISYGHSNWPFFKNKISIANAITLSISVFMNESLRQTVSNIFTN